MKKSIITTIFVLLTISAQAQDIGKWYMLETEDIMTGQTRYSLILEADATSGTLHTPAIIIYHHNGSLHGFVYFGGYSIDYDVTTMVGYLDGEQLGVGCFRSQDGADAYLYDDFIPSIADISTLALSVRSATGRIMQARFDTRFFAEAVALMMENMEE
jgi:hypothetical protein